ncbi:tRNA (adenosine(37)-N6)-threonylcarbamoyltransferase complex ATPase subunit type 1 TsaE [Acetivibrio cellulolyticus]|uniref:tRNA (adenosine(37)-N6)-threonylcarbamoyltransferase complex ATPase subunit type 1 TsaE n=1 Tax=Acetivibrio cellulolyticus TaxID=35830 RepID=UPI0001E2D12F|nr:tRNA (adenosine(37)-N6)-threonylcarbamoyltransferase complex ATPase subunit type 1 TsaE [Acetivibrio cellulolyticus]
MKQIKTYSADETTQVGRALGSILNRGDVVCLTGDLGTGKTALTNGIASALGIEDYITSPTFTIVNEYKTEVPLYHFDVYRISDPEEMYDIGFEEYLYGEGVVVIEWAELIKGILPDDLIWVKISKDLASGVDTREISIDFQGEKYEGYIDRLKL